jgi:hypothetical protein
VKRNESLRSIHIVAIGSAEAFAGLAALRAAGLGPDMLIEHADLPEGLSDALRLSRVEREEAELQPASALVPESVPSPEPEPAEPVAGSASAEPSPEIVRAERLARIVVSDIVLYNAERFERAAREGGVLDALAAELSEGRTLFRQRVPAEVCETRDFLAEELLRVARMRASH